MTFSHATCTSIQACQANLQFITTNEIINLYNQLSSLIILHNAIRTNYVKVKIDNMQQNNKCWWCGEIGEIVNHPVSECSKLKQKEYKTRHDKVVKVIHREVCRGLTFDYTIEWYMHKPESFLEKETHKILLDFEIQTLSEIGTRKADLPLITKKKKKKKKELTLYWILL